MAATPPPPCAVQCWPRRGVRWTPTARAAILHPKGASPCPPSPPLCRPPLLCRPPPPPLAPMRRICPPAHPPRASSTSSPPKLRFRQNRQPPPPSILKFRQNRQPPPPSILKFRQNRQPPLPPNLKFRQNRQLLSLAQQPLHGSLHDPRDKISNSGRIGNHLCLPSHAVGALPAAPAVAYRVGALPAAPVALGVWFPPQYTDARTHVICWQASERLARWPGLGAHQQHRPTIARQARRLARVREIGRAGRWLSLNKRGYREWSRPDSKPSARSSSATSLSAASSAPPAPSTIAANPSLIFGAVSATKTPATSGKKIRWCPSSPPPKVWPRWASPSPIHKVSSTTTSACPPTGPNSPRLAKRPSPCASS